MLGTPDEARIAGRIEPAARFAINDQNDGRLIVVARIGLVVARRTFAALWARAAILRIGAFVAATRTATTLAAASTAASVAILTIRTIRTIRTITAILPGTSVGVGPIARLRVAARVSRCGLGACVHAIRAIVIERIRALATFGPFWSLIAIRYGRRFRAGLAGCFGAVNAAPSRSARPCGSRTSDVAAGVTAGVAAGVIGGGSCGGGTGLRRRSGGGLEVGISFLLCFGGGAATRARTTPTAGRTFTIGHARGCGTTQGRCGKLSRDSAM